MKKLLMYANEIMLLCGAVLFGFGLGIRFGFGSGLIGTGGVFVGAALFNAWLESRERGGGLGSI